MTNLVSPLYRVLVVLGVVVAVTGGVLTVVSVVGRHDVTVRRPAAEVSAAPTTGPSEVGVPPAPADQAPSESVPTAVARDAPPVGVPPGPATPDAPAAPPGETSPGDTASPSVRDAVALSCPAPLPPSTIPGGLASLTVLIPVFGPFSPEVFAGVPLFQPFFPLVAPLLNQGEQQLGQLQPLIEQAVPLVQLIEEAAFVAAQPAYAPFRPQFLQMVEQFATSLEPLARTAAEVPGAGCLPALQAALLSIASAP